MGEQLKLRTVEADGKGVTKKLVSPPSRADWDKAIHHREKMMKLKPTNVTQSTVPTLASFKDTITQSPTVAKGPTDRSRKDQKFYVQ